jgi:hypothetical protein
MPENKQPTLETSDTKADAKEELSFDELGKVSGGLRGTSSHHTLVQPTFTFQKIDVENLTPGKSAPDDWTH